VTSKRRLKMVCSNCSLVDVEEEAIAMGCSEGMQTQGACDHRGSGESMLLATTPSLVVAAAKRGQQLEGGSDFKEAVTWGVQ
jgi:hypothetical protein